MVQVEFRRVAAKTRDGFITQNVIALQSLLFFHLTEDENNGSVFYNRESLPLKQD